MPQFVHWLLSVQDKQPNWQSLHSVPPLASVVVYYVDVQLSTQAPLYKNAVDLQRVQFVFAVPPEQPSQLAWQFKHEVPLIKVFDKVQREHSVLLL